ncbi:MAG: hypothetical protein LBG59_02645 [Candidatus Peribacteria bacterium]|jgi:hypothetical protein|nr:hypothetical protein [Candidatus Peribacteria bacterium]
MPSSIGGGLINLEIDTTAVPYTSSTFDGTINGVRIEGGSTIKNKIRSGLQQGLRKFIIDNFLDPQIRYIANNLTKMHISLRRPDFNDLGKEITKIGELVSQAGSSISEKSKEISENYQTNIQALNATNNKNTARFADTAYSHLSTFIEKANDKIANPFEQLSKLFNQSKLINIQTKTLTVKFPMIYSEDINAYEIYLRQWGDTQLQILEDWEKRVESLL